MISVGGSSSLRRISLMMRPGDEAHRQAADAGQHELEAGLGQRERPRDHRRDRELVEHERGPVVGEVLALDDRQQAPRRPDTSQDLRRGYGVGGGDDRAQYEGGPPVEPDHVVRDGGNRDHGDQHHRHGQQEYRARVAAQVAQRREERGAVEQRRQEDEQHQLRVELDLRDAGHEADDGAAEHQRDRVGNPQYLGQHGEGHDAQQQAEDHEFRVLHASRVTSDAVGHSVRQTGLPPL